MLDLTGCTCVSEDAKASFPNGYKHLHSSDCALTAELNTEREYAAADLDRVAREIKAIVEDRAESLRSGEIGDLLFAASTIEGVAFADKLLEKEARHG